MSANFDPRELQRIKKITVDEHEDDLSTVDRPKTLVNPPTTNDAFADMKRSLVGVVQPGDKQAFIDELDARSRQSVRLLGDRYSMESEYPLVAEWALTWVLMQPSTREYFERPSGRVEVNSNGRRILTIILIKSQPAVAL